MTTVHLRAPAKLTTSLRISGVRDDGYHVIDAEMITVDLYDDLTIDPDGSGVVWAHDSTVPPPAGFDPTDNLISAALGLAEVDAGVEMVKRIPAGAGLGGGSADAAAVLRWAGFADVERAASIGADVAFCLVGGRARVSGIGEVVEPLPFVPQTFTLRTPAIHCSTPEVYRRWDQLGGPFGDNGNDLEAAAISVAPAMAAVRDSLGDDTGCTPRLAGSGSTWFVEGAHPNAGLVVHAVPAEALSGSAGDGTPGPSV